MIVFGPVPSRRLGRSLGINNIPAKICTYSCIYCQLGNTIKTQVNRQPFFKPERIIKEVKEKIKTTKKKKETIDYLTFVPDGEPTLDRNLGTEIELLRSLEIKIAVITNASLIYKKDVKDDLSKADLVSFKVDTVTENTWHNIDRPSGLLKLQNILDGILEFSQTFNGTIITETMLIKGVNDNEQEIKNIGRYLGLVNPSTAFIAIPTRPPAEQWAKPAEEYTINIAYQIFSEILGMDKTEYLIGYEGSDFAFNGHIEETLLSITSVHPMRADAVKKLLEKASSEWSLVEDMIKEKKLIELEYNKHKFYMRKIPSRM